MSLYNSCMAFRHHCYKCIILLQVFLLAAVFVLPVTERVEAQSAPFNAYDLIGAVNALRADHGLPEFNINGSLMASAQAHTEYQAANQTMTHYGPGGNTANERAQAAGYVGRVSENIAAYSVGYDEMLTWVVYEAWSDEVHMNTMINPQYKDVGAGVVVGGDRVYVTLDAGWPEGRYDLPTRQTWTPGGTADILDFSSTLVFEAIIISTPNPDGSLVHVVGYGQSLIGIAGAYGVSIADLQTLNNINPDQIYDGQKLIIRQAVTPTITQPPTQEMTLDLLSLTGTTMVTETIPGPVEASPMRITGIIIIAICIAGAAILLTSRR